MSTIKVSNIRIASEAVSRPVTGVAASWISVNGTGTTDPASMTSVRASLNVASVIDSSTGKTGVNLTSDMDSSTNYAITTTKQDVVVNTDTTSFDVFNDRRAGSYQILCVEGGTPVSATNVNAVQMGDLA